MGSCQGFWAKQFFFSSDFLTKPLILFSAVVEKGGLGIEEKVNVQDGLMMFV